MFGKKRRSDDLNYKLISVHNLTYFLSLFFKCLELQITSAISEN